MSFEPESGTTPEKGGTPKPVTSDFSRENTAEKLREWKHEEGQIWGDMTWETRHELKLRLDAIMDAQRALPYFEVDCQIKS